MRDLAAAAGLNVASLYHYFPSKRDLLVAVLEERGVLNGLSVPDTPAGGEDSEESLAQHLSGMLGSMLQIEQFARLMLGEVLRGDETARAVGRELMSTTLDSLEQWLKAAEPSLCEAAGPAATARVLRAVMLGIFFEHLAGVMAEEGEPSDILSARAAEVARVLHGRPDRPD